MLPIILRRVCPAINTPHRFDRHCLQGNPGDTLPRHTQSASRGKIRRRLSQDSRKKTPAIPGRPRGGRKVWGVSFCWWGGESDARVRRSCRWSGGRRRHCCGYCGGEGAWRWSGPSAETSCPAHMERWLHTRSDGYTHGALVTHTEHWLHTRSDGYTHGQLITHTNH